MAGYYKLSGKFTPAGLLMGLASGLAASFPLGILYNYSIVEVPSVKLRMIFTVLFGVLLGVACGWGLHAGKTRNDRVAGWMGIAVSSGGLYLSWVNWILHQLQPDRWILNPLPLALRPGALWKLMVAINAEGTWSTGGGEPDHGFMLWVIWILEAVVVIGAGWLAAQPMADRKPFCEICGTWCSRQPALIFGPRLDEREFQSHLESGDARALNGLEAGSMKEAHYRLDLDSCGNCHRTNTATLTRAFPGDHKQLFSRVCLTDEQTSVLRDMAGRPRAKA